MKELIKKYWWILIIIFFGVSLILIDDYKYNKCVEIEKENLRECMSYEDSECSVFENAEELCGYKVYR